MAVLLVQGGYVPDYKGPVLVSVGTSGMVLLVTVPLARVSS